MGKAGGTRQEQYLSARQVKRREQNERRKGKGKDKGDEMWDRRY